MKIKEIFFAVLLLTILLISDKSYSQNLTEDEEMRVKYSVHLVTYDTVSAFDNSLGEAYFKLLVFTFAEEQIIPEINFQLLSDNDRKILQNHVEKFNIIKANPPAWEELLLKEAEYLKWIDASQRRQSKYKN
jgi:hypothetical protein